MNTKVKKVFKIILQAGTFNYLKSNKSKITSFIHVLKGYHYDFRRYYKFSDTNGSDTSSKLIGKIIREYHVIEKGLTMPQTRLGFGKELVLSLCADCKTYLTNYGNEDEQLIHAIGVLLEYKQVHDSHNIQLDIEIITALKDLEKYILGIKVTSQKEMTRKEYFNHIRSPFLQFSNSRSSIRNYSIQDISINKILEVLELVRNTPSACNRQSWRTYVHTDKAQIYQILDIQGGNRGFGHLTNKLIIVTGELGVFNGQGEKNQVFIDGGMYVMNVLYALHYYQIGACILNCSISVEKDKRLRHICKIKESEVFIAMVACGIPPESFMIAASKRYSIDKTNKIIETEI